MKKFYFALDTVLNYKEQVLENLQAEHAQIIAERVECERGIEALEQEQQECMAELETTNTFSLHLINLRISVLITICCTRKIFW